MNAGRAGLRALRRGGAVTVRAFNPRTALKLVLRRGVA